MTAAAIGLSQRHDLDDAETVAIMQETQPVTRVLRIDYVLKLWLPSGALSSSLMPAIATHELRLMNVSRTVRYVTYPRECQSYGSSARSAFRRRSSTPGSRCRGVLWPWLWGRGYPR